MSATILQSLQWLAVLAFVSGSLLIGIRVLQWYRAREYDDEVYWREER